MSRNEAKPVPLRRGGEQVTNKDGLLGWRLKPWDARAGRQLDKTFYGTYTQAVRELGTLTQSVNSAAQPAPVGAARVKVGTWAAQWLADYAWKVKPTGENPGIMRPKTTWRNAKYTLYAYILPTLGNETLTKLTREDCYDAIAGLRVRDGSAEAAPETKAKAASVLRLMLEGAEAAGIVHVNVAAKLPTVWGKRGQRLVIPSLVQVEKLAETMATVWPTLPTAADVVRLFAYTGLRWEELAALTWDDIYRDKSAIQVWHTRPSSTNEFNDTVKTEASGRFATIIDQASGPLKVLREFADEHNSPYVLTSATGKPLHYSTWRKKLAVARAESGVPYTAHELRHVCASILIAGGASSIEVRDQMGHSRSQVTESVYRHAMKLDRTQLAKALTQAVTAVEVEGEVEELTET